MSKYPTILLYVFLVITVLSPFASTQVGAQTEAKDNFVPRIVTFVADHSILDMPEGIAGLVMESDQCYGCKSGAAQWQLLGDSLRISQVARFDQKYPLLKDDVVKESQVERISFHSADLVSAITQIKPLYIGKRIPHAKSGATREWDPVRLQWYTLADFSTFYAIVLNEETSMALARETLEGVPGVKSVGYIPRAVSAGFECKPGVEPWLPDDTLWYKYASLDTAWYFKAPEDQLGGLNMPCAWGLLDDNERGNVLMAIVPEMVDTTHEDLDVSNCTNYTYSPDAHDTRSVGCAAARGNNLAGASGTAPDAWVSAYSYYWTPELGYDSAYRFKPSCLNLDLAVEDSARVIMYPHLLKDYDPLLFEVLRKVKASNCVMVASTGNIDEYSPGDYEPYMSYPSVWDSLCISVGMIDSSGEWSDSSNYAPCDDDTCRLVDVLAPGFRIRTTRPGGYTLMTGTSAAAPLVAGIVALAKSYDASLTPDVIEEMLEATADRSGLSYPSDSAKYGSGRVDAYAFLDAIINSSVPREASTLELADSIPALIITDDSLVSSFSTIADYRTARGTHTEIVSTQSIAQQYSGSDLAEKVRACIEDYYDNKHLEWVILGGDSSIIPFRYAYTNLYGPGVRAISDYYYACLDGDWNAGGSDTLWGEIEDSVDLVPEVAVGRLPLTSTAQVANYTSKWTSYQSGSPSGWQDDVLGIGTKMFNPGDGAAIVDALLELFPNDFEQTTLADTAGGSATAQNYFTNMNQGQGILLYYGMAQHSANFFINRETQSLFTVDDIDTLSNTGKAGLVYSATCWNNKLDTVSIAAQYINHPTGGAVAYIGTSHNDYIYITYSMAREFWSLLFGDGPKEVGRLLNEAKECLLDIATHYDVAHRHSMFGYLLAGDPQLDIWTALPEEFDLSFTDSIYIGLRSLTVSATEGEDPVADVTVCLMQDSTVYAVSKTDSLGEATFDSIQFTNNGVATVAGTKHNFVSVVDSLPIVGCCVGDMGNVDCDSSDVVDITDMQVLVDHLFLTLAPLCCEREADLDLDGTVDVTDLNILNDHLFLTLAPLDSCP